jgi:Holliday junction resolvase
MANKNGRKGSLFETTVLKWLRSKNVIAERLTKAGAKDEGDIVVMANGKTYILELKATKALKLPEFWNEAVVEAKNYAHARSISAVPPSYVIIKRRMAGINQAWVVEDFDQWIKKVTTCRCVAD